MEKRSALGEAMMALAPVSQWIVSEEERRRLESVACGLLEEDGRFEEELLGYGSLFPLSFPEVAPLTLLVDDFSIIAHLDGVRGLRYYASRAFTRAQEGDLVAGTFEPIEGIEDYLGVRLGLGRSRYFQVPPSKGAQVYATFAGILEDEGSQQVLLEAMSSSGGELWIHPYMGLRDVWRLGRLLEERSGGRVQILAPLPTITEQTNDKVWFTEVVRRTLGEEAAMLARPGRTVEEAALCLRELAEISSRVSLKLANSATGMGTGIFGSEEILSRTEEDLLEFVGGWVKEKEWDGRRDPALSVERWQTDRLASPSTQLWIPPLESGPPLLEGVFDQLFDAQDDHVFLGSVASRLPEEVQERLGESSLKLGYVFQRLGYLGRCSFDTILCGESLEEATIKYVECNGRWGGTSTPMTLMNRVFGDFRALPYLARGFYDDCVKGVSFAKFVEVLDDVLYSRETGEGWALVFNVGCLLPSGKLDVITFGETLEEAEARQEEFGVLVRGRFG